MDLRYENEDSSIFVSILPQESDAVAIVMQLVLEEERGRGVNVPNFDNEFFLNLATTRKKVCLKFDYEHLDFTLAFLVEICLRWDESGYDVEDTLEFLDLMDEQFPEGRTIQ